MKLTTSLFLFLGFATILTASTTHAKAMAAGCFDPTGMERNNKLSQGGKVLTNALSSPVTSSAMASGTSNCKTNGFANNNVETGLFVVKFKNELRAELASGTGEHLIALTHLLGCQSHQNVVVDALENPNSPILQKATTEASIYNWIQTVNARCS